MVQLRATGPYLWVTWLPRLLSGESSCEWASWFKAQHEGWSWSRMPSDFDQAGWLLNHTALLNEQRLRWEQQGYTVLTEGQNSFNLRGSSAVLAGTPDLVARRRDQITVIDTKTGRPHSGPHRPGVDLHVRPSPRIGTLQRAEHRRPSGLPRARGGHPGRCGRREVRRELGAASSAAWRRRCRPDGCPAQGNAASVRSRRPTAPSEQRRPLRKKARPTISNKR